MNAATLQEAGVYIGSLASYHSRNRNLPDKDQ